MTEFEEQKNIKLREMFNAIAAAYNNVMTPSGDVEEYEAECCGACDGCIFNNSREKHKSDYGICRIASDTCRTPETCAVGIMLGTMRSMLDPNAETVKKAFELLRNRPQMPYKDTVAEHSRMEWEKQVIYFLAGLKERY